MRRFAAIALTAPVACLLFFACGGDDASGPNPGNGASTVASVGVTPGSAVLVSLGETVQLAASAQNASGSTLAGKTYTWSSSNTSIATVTASGEVTAVQNGMATVQATTDGISGASTIVVNLTCGPAGMVSWWPGDGNAIDVIGPNEGTLTGGATHAAGHVGQAFSFGGVDGEFSSDGAGISTLQQLTIEAWVKHETLPAQIQRYVTIAGAGAKAVLRHDGGAGPQQLHFFMGIGGVLRHVRVNNVLQTGTFHHVAGTYDGGVMRLYLDGVEVGNFSVVGAVADGAFINLSSSVETLNGFLDEVAIYDRALSATEIQAIFDAGSAGKCGI